MSLRISRRAATFGAALLPMLGHAASGDGALLACIAGGIRSPKNVARDRYRHPLEVLRFFGLRADQAVLEIEPGGGYWTEILAPFLKARGKYTAAVPMAGAELPGVRRFLAKLQADPTNYGAVAITPLADDEPLAPPGSQDLILSFRNLHDWMADGTAAAKLSAVHAALKRGGVFGLEDHRANPDAPQDPLAKSGYVREDYAKNLIRSAGFRLAGESPIGDNPLDTKDYPKGVWTLPPVLAAGPADRAKYLAIGESDRWTMKFRKV